MNNNIILSIVTPNLNGGKYLEKTIKSVLAQKTKFIEYIVIDGQSNDNSKFILNKYKNKIDKIIFKKDKSMYEAIETGFKIAKGKYLTWINSDDLYYKNSLIKSVNIMEKKKIKWANGISSTLKNDKIHSINFPYYFPKKFIKNGDCHKSAYGFIPQESVIFTKKIFHKAGGFKKNKKIAGDFFLWKKFANYENLIPINVKIGIFRKRKGQLSEDLREYYKEIGNIELKKSINSLRIIFSFLYYLFKRN